MADSIGERAHRAGSGPCRPSRVLVVIPALNEQASIGVVVTELQSTQPQLDVLVVDDGSSDSTAAVASAHGATVLRLPYNLGVGAAMRAGFLYASRSGYDGVVQVDADGQHDTSTLGALLEGLASADVVVGSRFVGGASYEVRGPRRWAMRLLAVTVSRMCSTTLSDVTSGFRAAGPRAVHIFARFYPPEYLGDTVESLVLAKKSQLLVREVPVTIRPRLAGRPSQSTFSATVYLARAGLVLLLAMVRQYPGARVGTEGPR